MQAANAIRLARQRVARHASGVAIARSLATAAHVGSGAAGSSAPSTSSSRSAAIQLSNIEAMWGKLSSDEKGTVHEQLEVLQKKDWKELSIDEKKAAYYVAFGPHGPRAPTSQPGDGLKVLFGTLALVGVAGALSLAIHGFAAPPPKTISKEWEEATNERALEMKLNPITGISSDGYKGKGFVTHK